MSDDNDKGLSLEKVLILLLLLGGLISWCVSANAYAKQHGEGWQLRSPTDNADADAPVGRMRVRRSSAVAFAAVAVMAFLGNSLVELPHLPQVIWFAMTDQTWLSLLFLIFEGGSILGYFGMRYVDKQLNPPVLKVKRRKFKSSKVSDL